MTQEVSYRSKKNYYLRDKKQRNFFASPWAGGVLLVAFAVIAILLANIEATKHIYHAILQAQFTVGFPDADFAISKTVEQWVNDGLMVMFFFVVGLEIKREIVAGQLASPRKALLPIGAALGGMLVPAAIYAAFNGGTPYIHGWGIPMATDIAFAIGVLSLLGSRVPVSLKIFLTALAIVDDLGAIVVIAIFYTSQIDFVLLGCSAAVLLLMWLMGRRNVYNMGFYLIPCIVLWVLFLYSGIHSTIAGVLMAMVLPVTPRFSKKYFSYKSRNLAEEFRFYDCPGQEVLSNPEQHHALNAMSNLARNAVSPSQRLEHSLYPFVTFFVMPLFALVNAGVALGGWESLAIWNNTQGAGIFGGLVLGKPIGILLFSWIMVRFGFAELPAGASWRGMVGVACLGGIGFTMSIFIDTLAFAGTDFVEAGKIAVLVSSVAASLLGVAMVWLLGGKPPKEEKIASQGL